MSQKGESSGERQVRFSPEVEEFPAKRQRRRRRGGSRGSDEDQNPREPSADHAEERYSKDTAPPAVRSRGGEQVRARRKPGRARSRLVASCADPLSPLPA